MAIIDPAQCSTNTLARVLGLSRHRVGRLHRQGILTQTARGKYDLLEASRSYRQYKATTRKADTYSAASLELKRQLVRKTKIANERILGKLLDVDEVQELVCEIADKLSSSMDGLPDRVAALTIDMTDPGEIRTKILTETRAIRSRIADKIAPGGGNGSA